MPCWSYPRLLARHSHWVLFAVATLSAAAIVAVVTLKDRPDFTDPQAGFETRGTSISAALTTWSNLLDSVSHLGPLTSNPLEGIRAISRSKDLQEQRRQRQQQQQNANRGRKRRKKKRRQKQQRPTVMSAKRPTSGITTTEPSSLFLNSSTTKEKRDAADSDEYDEVLEDDDEELEEPSAEAILLSAEHRGIGWMCGEPMADYAHVVFEANAPDDDLFSHRSLLSMCTLESTHLRSAPQFKDLCETKGPADCCPGWNLGGYVALLFNRSSCFGITEDDVKGARELLQLCSRYYHNGDLYPDCMHSRRPCNHIPQRCTVYNAVYTMLHFLADDQFMSPKIRLRDRKLKSAVSFLPIARSSATLDFFHSVSRGGEVRNARTRVAAMDLGVREALFDQYLVQDAKLLLIALGLIVLCVLAFTHSFFLTLLTVLTVAFSLGLAAFLYYFVLGVEFFPFMNVLAVVIAVGVGADDTFILVKCWSQQRPKQCLDSSDSGASVGGLCSSASQAERRVSATLRQCWLSLVVTSVTTAVAFLASAVSAVTAIRCFSLFAGMAILCNLFLMLTWVPAGLVFYQRYCHASCCCCLRSVTTAPDGTATEHLDTCRVGQVLCGLRPKMARAFALVFERVLPNAIIVPRYLWIFTLGGLFACSLLAIFYKPGLRLPDQEDLQLFTGDHVFERYERQFRRRFGFERQAARDVSMRMPLRFVWGVQPVDNGDHLDPADRGDLVYDPNFDISTPDAQRWMLKFCEDVRKQPFFAPGVGPALSNCFMKTFKEWMERRCKDTLSGINRAPCCQASRFPFSKAVFEGCLLQAVEDLYETPTELWIPGVAGPKFNISTGVAEVVVIEYDAEQIFSFSHAEMDAFYNQVNDWFSRVITTAPPELRGGFFMSYLGFYDVQSSLSRDTLFAVCIAVVAAVLVLAASTLNVALAFLAAVSVAAAIAVSVGALLGLGWKLNILESVAITLIIGLSVDFTLHYAVMYRHSATARAKRRRRSSCSSSTTTQQQQQLNYCDRAAASEADVVYSVSQMSAPVSMAAATTLIAGLCLLPSRVLAYSQIGTFIAVVMSASLVYSTFFFQSLLSVFSPTAQTCSPKSDNNVVERAKYLFTNREVEDQGQGGQQQQGEEASVEEHETEERDVDDERAECFTVQQQQQQQQQSSINSIDRDIEVVGSANGVSNVMPNTASNVTNISTFTSLSAVADNNTVPPPPPLPSAPVTTIESLSSPLPPPVPPEMSSTSVPPQIITLGTSYRGDRGNVSTCDIHMSMNDVTVVDGFTGPNGLRLQKQEIERLQHSQEAVSSMEPLQYSSPTPEALFLSDQHQDGTATLPSSSTREKGQQHRRAHSNSQPKGSVHFAAAHMPSPSVTYSPPPPPVQMIETAIVAKEYKTTRHKRKSSDHSLKSPTAQDPQQQQPSQADVEATAAWMARKRQEMQQLRKKSSSSNRGSADSVIADNDDDVVLAPDGDSRLQHRSDVVMIHCDAPTIRADLVHQKMRRKSGGGGNAKSKPERKSVGSIIEPPVELSSKDLSKDGRRKYSLAVVQVAPKVQKPTRSRLKSLPSNSIEVPNDATTEVKPPVPAPRSTSKMYQQKDNAKSEAEVVKAVVTHRRKNSYRIAQEEEPLEFRGESGRERRKSMGDSLEETKRCAAAGRQRAFLASSRNSSSLGNILNSSQEEQRASPLNFETEVFRRPKKRSKNAKPDSTPLRAVEQCPTVPPSSVNLRSSYHYERHPLSHSTTTVLNANSDDPEPIVPNKCPGTPDVWVPRTVVKA